MKNLAGQYLGDRNVVRLLGSTAYSEVYLVEGDSPDRQNALKLLRLDLSEAQWNVLLPASRSLRDLIHPHIIRVEKLVIVPLEKKFPALLMEYAPNGNLRWHYPVGSRLPVPTVLSYVQIIAEALHYAHLKNVVHGALRPENILLGSDNGILLSDFSFAMLSSITQIQPGTTAYLAPEQIQGEVGPLSDEYALGVMVYEWLTGDLPFSGSQAEIAEQHLSASPPPLRAKNPAISADIEHVVLTALAKDPGYRFANLLAFARAFEQASQIDAPPLSLVTNPVGRPDLATIPGAENSQTTASGIRSSDSARISRRALVLGLPLLTVVGGGLLAWELIQRKASSANGPGQPLFVYLGHSGGVTAAAWSPDGKYIASGGNDHTIQIWDVKNGVNRLVLHGLSGGVPAVSWSPDSTRIASAVSGPSVSGAAPAQGNGVQVWNITTGKITYIYHGHTGGITDIEWSPSGKRIASSSTDYTVQVWGATDGSDPLIYRTHSWYVWTLAWSPDGKRLATGRPDGTIQVWDATTGQTFLSFQAHLAAVEAITWSPDGKYIATASDDSTVRVWNASSGTPLLTYSGHSNYVLTAAWSPDGRYIASGGSDKTTQVWQSTTGKARFTYAGYSGGVTTVTWSPDSQEVATGSADGSVQVLQVA